MIKRSVLSISFLFLFLTMLFLSITFPIEVRAQTETFEPKYGDLPVIDGYINQSSGEWNNALKTTLVINSTSKTDIGIPIKFWIMQNDSGLFICVQLELEFHANNEFIGFLISRATNREKYVDAKIVQFTNVLKDDYEYLDLHIVNNVFKRDSIKEGAGAAQLDKNTMVYEFEIPVNNSAATEQDVFLDFGLEYAFKLIFGESKSYPSGIMKSTVFEVSIQYPPPSPKGFDYTLLFSVLSIITFSSLGSLYAFYMYKILILRKNLKKMQK